jgi:hypothetical protein
VKEFEVDDVRNEQIVQIEISSGDHSDIAVLATALVLSFILNKVAKVRRNNDQR